MYTIVVVDDNEDVRENICEILSELGRVFTAANSSEFYEILREHGADLVILDKNIPGEEIYRDCLVERAGIEIIEELMGIIKTGAEILLLTGYPISPRDAKLIEKKAHLYSKQEINIIELREIVQKLLTERSKCREQEQILVRRIASAYLVDHTFDEPLQIDNEYNLAVQILPQEEDNHQKFIAPIIIPQIELKIFAVVYAEDMEILPDKFAELIVGNDGFSEEVQFTLVPRESPRMQRLIEIQFFYRGKGLQNIRFEVDTQDDQSNSNNSPIIDDPKVPLDIYLAGYTDITLKVYSDSRGFSADVVIDGDFYEDKIMRDTASGWEVINSSLCSDLNNAEKIIGQKEIVSEDEALEVVQELLHAGEWAFNYVFRDVEMRNVIANILRTVSLAREPIIEIISDRPLIPWDLLRSTMAPPNNDSKSNSIYDIWGMKCFIQQSLPSSNPKVNHTRVNNSSEIILGILWNDKYKCVREFEINFLDGLRCIGVVRRPVLKFAEPKDLLINYLSETMDVIQFACHAQGEKSVPESFLELSNGTRVTLKWLQTGHFTLSGRPVVILNSCGSLKFDATHMFNFLHAFSLSGAGGVLGTKCWIQAPFASRFITAFYNRYLSGEVIGYCILKTRQEFWEEYRNPLGLIFSYYGGVRKRVKPFLPA